MATEGTCVNVIFIDVNRIEVQELSQFMKKGRFVDIS